MQRLSARSHTYIFVAIGAQQPTPTAYWRTPGTPSNENGHHVGGVIAGLMGTFGKGMASSSHNHSTFLSFSQGEHASVKITRFILLGSFYFFFLGKKP